MKFRLSSMKKLRLFSIFLSALSLFIVLNCIEDNELIPITAELTDYTGCKQFSVSRDGETYAHEEEQECVEYEYRAGRVLYIKHINAEFYCDAKVWSEIEIEGDIIEIKEYYSGLADCYCLFDVEYELQNIKPAIYVIKISTLSFIVDLMSHPQGSYCVDREEYYWF